jgi:hypothetical protein
MQIKEYFFSFLCFLQRPIQLLEFYTYFPKQKRNTKSSFNPFNAKNSFEAYLHIPVSKADEGNFESYKGFTYVHCLSVVAGIGVEKR